MIAWRCLIPMLAVLAMLASPWASAGAKPAPEAACACCEGGTDTCCDEPAPAPAPERCPCRPSAPRSDAPATPAVLRVVSPRAKLKVQPRLTGSAGPAAPRARVVRPVVKVRSEVRARSRAWHCVWTT